MNQKNIKQINRYDGTGGIKPNIILDETTKDAITNCFKQNKLSNATEFFSKLEEGIALCVMMARNSQEYSSKEMKKEFKSIEKQSNDLLSQVAQCNIQTKNYIDMIHYGDHKRFFMDDELITAVSKLADISKRLSKAPKRKHTYIHYVTSSIVQGLREHSDYIIDKIASEKVSQLLDILLPSVEKSLLQVLPKDSMPDFGHINYAVNVTKNYFDEKYRP